MGDIEIARSVKLKNIKDIAASLGVPEENLELYGNYKAKISDKVDDDKKSDAKLVLVTAINPTPLGEGKTTVAIGLADALRKLDKKSVLALREPSMGPVFGIKGGATGGGYAQIAPMEDINLHFTGDFHAIETANNLLASCIDNHIYSGNKLNFKEVCFKRCIDLNDRALRKIQINLSEEKNMNPRFDGFDITAASEVMAIFCLAKDIDDLRKRLENIIVGYNENEEPIFAKDLNVVGAMLAVLKDAIKPNLVQTLEHTPAIVHGGPFANIAHGCNSVIATNLARSYGEYVVTEAGFGADLGAEKFFDIKCRNQNLKPNCTVCVATIRALKYHGGQKISDIENENLDYLKNGLENLYKHISNLKNVFKQNVVVAINKFPTDTQNEIEFLKNSLKVWSKGGNGAIELAQIVENLCKKENKLEFSYEKTDSFEEKVEKICRKIYGAKNIIYSESAKKELEMIKKNSLDNLLVCISKTQYSFSDNPKNLNIVDDFDISVKSIELKNGAGFIVVKTGKIFSMPGLPKIPAAESIDVNDEDEIIGVY